MLCSATHFYAVCNGTLCPLFMVALPNIGGALCSTPQSLADVHCWSTVTRRETRWSLQGCPKLANSSQPLLGRSSPYYEDMWRRHWCLTSFFPINSTCLRCEDMAQQSCAMVPRWRFLHPAFSAIRMQHISDMHSKFALRPDHMWKYGRHSIADSWDKARKKKKDRNHMAKI